MDTPRKQFTSVFVIKENKILLGYKKRGFGVGLWNGFGGKLDKGESYLEAAKREMQEESSVVCNHLEECGRLEFECVGKNEILEVHVFRTNMYEGKPLESEEMKPEWFDIDQIPYKTMWPDDLHWFPYLLNGSKFKGYFLYKALLGDILKVKLQAVDSFSS